MNRWSRRRKGRDDTRNEGEVEEEQEEEKKEERDITLYVHTSTLIVPNILMINILNAVNMYFKW